MRTDSKCVYSWRRGIVYLCSVVALSLALATSAQAQWVSTATKALSPYLSNATLIGSVPASTPMHIALGLQVRNAAQIQPTLQRMLTPGDPLYGRSFTVAQFVAQFAPTAAQVQAVENYLSSYGFTNVSVDDNQLIVQADGTAGDVQAAFNTALAEFSQNGKTIIANTLDAQVPQSLAGTVLAVLGLNNVANIKVPQPPSTNNILNGYTPQDYQIAYDAAYPGINNTKNGPTVKQKLNTGKSAAIGIISEGNLTQVVNDLRIYEKTYNLPQVPVYVVNAGIPSPDTSGADEWDLDSQTSTGIAQQVQALYFYVASSLTDSDIGLSINKAVSQNKVKAFNMSFGECEFFPYLDGAMLLDDEMFAEAALQGITPFASSDDQGSACPVEGTNGVPLSGPPDTSYPASSPYVIASGGTDLFTNADYSYDTETGWDASGGGPSYFETSPFWQAYTGGGPTPVVPSAEVGQRGVPDVAMCADPNTCGAWIVLNGTLTCCYGGTSLASPLSMGSWARIYTDHLLTKNVRLGFAGPLIYQLATSGPPPSSGPFNDIIAGSNGLFTALPGYDYVTGLGSWDIYAVNKVIPTSYPH